MVDSINPSASIQNILSVGKSQSYDDQKSGKPITSPGAPVDQVTLSEEAQSIVDVQASTQSASASLSGNESLTLSSDYDRLSVLL
jgi:hypothetical protein